MRKLITAIAIVTFLSSSAQERYVVTLELSQTHFTLDIWEHVKDAANTVTFEIPVDKKYYDSLTPGQRIVDDFRTGSLILNGSFGEWNVKVKSKRVQR